ncbi:MAG: hypothetical protein U1F53_07580 [Burkholderiaceae bacterium]
MSSTTARPRLILHVGTHKTGTSALQAALGGARDALLHDHGLLYADTRRPPWPDLPKHCSVYQAAAHGDAAAQARERELLLAEFEASRATTLLLSEEGLSEPDDRVLRFFEPLAQRFDIKVLCFLRRQDLFVEALFNQFVRESARRESRPILTFARAPATRARLDYHALLSRWATLGARVQALDFDGPAVRGPGLMAAFESALGLSAIGLPDQRANPTPDMRLALLLNRMNRLRVPYELTPLLHATRALTQGGLPAMRHLLGGDERRRLLAEFDASNERLASEYGVRFSTELPANEPACAVEDLDAGFTLQLLGGLSQARSPVGAAA